MNLFIVITLFVTITSIASLSLPETQYDERIVGGYPIEIEEAPYQASLQILDSNNTIKGFCGGVIIAKKFILTAGHCIKPITFKYVVGVGSTKVSKGDNIAVDRVYLHPRYDDTDYDFAILRLAKAVKFSDKVQAAKLPDEGNSAKPGEITVVSGWGRTQQDSKGLASELRATSFPILDLNICRRLYAGLPVRITSRMVCAGYLEGGKDSCNGDSGGPMVRESDKVLIGLVSWGLGCANPFIPGFYSNIVYVRQWIRRIAGV